MTVLVVFASSHGSTRGVAERVATRLTECGLNVVTASVAEVDDLADYEAVIAGSAVHDQTWLPEATRFLREHAAQLAHRPIWLFSVGMPGAVAQPLRNFAMREELKLQRQLEQVVAPREHRLFSGVVTPDAFPERSSRFFFRVMGCRYGDFRDWAEIDRWAANIAAELGGGRVSGPVGVVQ